MIGRFGAARVIAASAVISLSIGFALVAGAPATARAGGGPAPASVVTSPNDNTVAMQRVAGTDRYSTAVALAKTAFPTTAPIVFLATGADYPDALAAGPVAAKLGGPLLLTPMSTLPPNVTAELMSLQPSTVVVSGGTSVISARVFTQVASLLPAATITRIAGVDRYETARRLLSYGFAAATSAYVVTGDNYPDALSAAAAASVLGEPMLLVRGSATTLDAANLDLLKAIGVHSVTIAGGAGAVSSGIQTALTNWAGAGGVSRIGGLDRYATSAMIAKAAFNTAPNVFFATGSNFPDALAGSAVAGRTSSPLLTVPGTCVPNSTLDDVSVLGTKTATIIGGTGVISQMITALVPCAPGRPVMTATQVVPVAIGAETVHSTLDAVSCPSTSRCFAVGTRLNRGFIATETSGTWSTVAAPLPSDYSSPPMYAISIFQRISCASTTFCMAVGTYKNTSGHQFGLIETLAAGRWAARSVPLPSGSAAGSALSMTDIGCGGSLCVAVGAITGPYPIPDTGVVLTSDTGVWTMRMVPSPAIEPDRVGDQVDLRAVSCVSAECALVGQDFTKSMPLAEDYGTGAWSVQPITDEDPYGLDSVYCMKPFQCAAAGVTSEMTAPVAIETSSGSLFQSRSVVHEPSATNSLTADPKIACSDIHFCATNVEYDKTGLPNESYLELAVTGNGTNVPVVVPLPTDARGHGSTAVAGIQDIACPRAGLCVAVGQYVDSNQRIAGLLEVFSNGTWKASRLSAGSPSVVDPYWVQGLSCASPASCEVVAQAEYLVGWQPFSAGIAVSIHF